MCEGLASGHRHFKIKGAQRRHMPPDAGTRRDIAVIHAVRAAAGEDAVIMIDANNGYTLNLAKQVLAQTADCRLHWLEEAFHEDRVLYEVLQGWLRAEGLPVLIADGEGEASPSLLAWAQAKVIDVVQYDILSYGFSDWLALGAKLDGLGVQSDPPLWPPHRRLRGLSFGRRHRAHGVCGMGRDRHAWAGGGRLRHPDGEVIVPQTPGFGLALDEKIFTQAVAARGMVHRL